MSAQNGTFRSIQTNLKFMIMGAYDLQEFQVAGGPGWMTTEWYNVVAKTEDIACGKDVMKMVRPPLADRFKLAFHRETREQPVYELVLAKGGLKIQKSAADAEYTMSFGGTAMNAKAMQFPVLVHFLSSIVRHPGGGQNGARRKIQH